MPRPRKETKDKRRRAITMWVTLAEEVEIKRRATERGVSVAEYLRGLAFAEPLETLGPVPTKDGYILG